MADLPVIDADAHINEPIDVFAEFLDDAHRELRPRLITDTKGLTRILMDGKLYPETRLRQNHVKKVQGTQLGGMQKGASDPIARLDDMDTDGIDVQVLYGSLGLSISTIDDVDFAIAMSRACNDYYASFCSAAPDRLKCMATLAVQDMPAAVEELERAVTELGHVGVMLPPNHRGPTSRPATSIRSSTRRRRSAFRCRSTGATGRTCRRPAASASTRTSCSTPSGTRSSR